MIKRRQLMKSLGAGSLVLGLDLIGLQAHPNASTQEKMKVGVTPNSWGVWFPTDPLQPPWQRFLDEAVEAEYEWIEIGPYGYSPTDIPTLRSELIKRQLKVSAGMMRTHVELGAQSPDAETRLEATGKLLAGLGAPYLILTDDTYYGLFTGGALSPRQLERNNWKLLIATVHRWAGLLESRFGVKLLFQPHAETHVQSPEQIERFLEETDPKRVSLCLDIGHYAYRGGDPVSFLRRHHKRTPYLHLKNINARIRKDAVEAENMTVRRATAVGLFCELSQGVVNFSALRDVLREIDYSGWAAVDQEMYPVAFDKPLQIAKRNRAYLRDIGLG